MPLAKSKLTAQGRTSMPFEIRKRLGVGPGSVLEWDEKDEKVVVRRAGRYTSSDVHEALFSYCIPKREASTTEDIRGYIRRKHA